MEDIDLNALRDAAKSEEKTSLTLEEEISKLETDIRRLEETPEPPSVFEVFNNSSLEEQQQEVERVARNRKLEPDTYTIEKRRSELERDLIENPSLRLIRIKSLRSKLEKLKTGQ